MVVYIKANVSLHGLREKSVAKIVERLRKALESEFNPHFSSDLEIEVEEHAGTEEKE